MPRPSGQWTFTDGRFRNPAGQFIPDAAVLGAGNANRVSSDDAFELRHGNHSAGAATPEWLREMKKGMRIACLTCGANVGLADLGITSDHSRDWSKQP